MFFQIFTFELQYRLRRPATYLYFLILFLFAFIKVIYGGGAGGSEKTYVNSPYAIGQFLVILSIFEVMVCSAVMGVPVYRDIEHNTRGYFFAYPITERGYLLGRFFGSFIILLFISLGVHLGIMLGGLLGPVLGLEEASRFGPLRLGDYAYLTLVITLPNLFFVGAIFFGLVALTRKIYVTYVGSVLLFIGYLLANALTQDLEYQNVVDILDPFALNTYGNATKYWTPAEQNTQWIALSGNMLWNRLLWVSISLVIFAYTVWRFNFQDFLAVRAGKPQVEEDKPATPIRKTLPNVAQTFSWGINVRLVFRLARLEFSNIVRDVYFLAILLAGGLFLFLDGWFGSPTYGTPDLPVTYLMLEVKDFNYIIFVFIILIFYTGETVHRDRSVNYANIADALPVPNWVTYLSKLLALFYVCFLLVNLVMVSGVLNQTLAGYFRYEFDKYFTDLYLIELPEYLQLTMLAFFVHLAVNQKFLGHFVAIGIWVAMIGIRSFAEYGFNLWFYSYSAPYIWSDMNGLGHFPVALFWYHVYWLAVGAFLLILGSLLWQRGTETSGQSRWRTLRQRLDRTHMAGLALTAIIAVAFGANIYYNTATLNPYLTSAQSKQLQADYEKKYKKYERLAQPKITDVKVNIDLYPDEARTEAAGYFLIVNKSKTVIKDLHLDLSTQIYHTDITDFTIGGTKPTRISYDQDQRYAIYRLPRPMQPQDTLAMVIKLKAGYRGFTNGLDGRSIVANGSFINLGIFPSFGYSAGRELSSDKDRKKYGLPKRDYTLPTDTDEFGLHNLLFNDDGDYVRFEATISTPTDQIAVAPGYLQKEWMRDGRRYFYYKMDGEMDLFANVSAAAYAVKRKVWKGKSGNTVNVEVFHHPTHHYNLDRFIAGVTAALDYYEANFSPYQYRQMRILEFPRYANFAQSFPNTVPYSEGFGWIGNFSDPNDTDYAFYVTAHEVAHQWWGHQITPSYTRGANQISESMAEYGALMVLKHAYGEETMQKFLRYALDRYLRGRATEDKFEDNLLTNEGDAYIWYQKGSLVLYALQDLVGEEQLNKGFANFLKNAAFRQKPPFATTKEWYSYIKQVVPDSLQYFLKDNFERITLYENRCKEAKIKDLKNGSYEVSLTVDTRKIYYDGIGNEKGRGTGSDYVEIGVFAADGKDKRGMTRKTPLYLRKHKLEMGKTHTIKITVKGKPVKAGIDPYTKLIDRVPDDNLIPVSE